ncbi:hypothetical protein Vretimale_16262 [Volvox reticuliferus]|uniref:Nudix hydrolase domain-containing protein n=1 Tax=Volvox reticuliferus TaxID=1737510 RepID=A0A8J4GQQ9_9CHLO|nr:hypothetical protein Vretimale_16262 [Volvox reticuliferus]
MRGPLAINPSKGPWVLRRRESRASAPQTAVPPTEALRRHHRAQNTARQLRSLRPICAALLAKRGAALPVVLLRANAAALSRSSAPDFGLNASRVLGQSPFTRCSAPTPSRYSRRIPHLSCCASLERCECSHGYGCLPGQGSRPPLSLPFRGVNPTRPAAAVTAAATAVAEAASFISIDPAPGDVIGPTPTATGTGALASPDIALSPSYRSQLRLHGAGSERRASVPPQSLHSLLDRWGSGLHRLLRGWKFGLFATACHGGGRVSKISTATEMTRSCVNGGKEGNDNEIEGCCQPTSNCGSATHEARETRDVGGGGHSVAGESSLVRSSEDGGIGGRVEAGRGGGNYDVGVGGESTSTTWPPAEERLAAVVQRLRALPRELYPPVSFRAAAVLVGLFEDQSGVVRVLLTQRSAHLKSHRGEVCLPGGKRDEEDLDDIGTALREAQEELGLDPARVTVLACLPPVLSKHHLSVTPVIALVPADMVPRPNPHEVAAAFTVPLAVFLGQFIDPRVMAEEASRTGASLPAHAAQPPNDSKATGRRTRSRIAAAKASDGAPVAKHPIVGSCLSAAAAGSTAAASSWDGLEDMACAEGGRKLGEDVKFASVVHNFRDIRWGEHEYRIHSFQYGEYDVWGLTATICIDAARLALGREPAFPERCPGGHHYSAFFWDGTALRVRPCAATAPRGPHVEGAGVSATSAAEGTREEDEQEEDEATA